ncbi:MAG: MFS transporter [Bacteroidetes bacterium]|nr:MAG: MFS transporter [Bacteroidota bacterium]
MLTGIFQFYLSSFRGLRREVWYLALITLINRSGTMVIPFLSLYLTKELSFGLDDVGSVMSAFGFGSLVGSWIGGKLTTRLGFYPVILWSLILSGIGFVLLQYVSGFWWVCLSIFLLTAISDALRPAIYVGLNAYSKVENRTRSVSLIRMAINLGFALGPALGGIIISMLSYKGLFWVDGITCVLAGFVFLSLLDAKSSNEQKKEAAEKAGISPYRDFPYLLLMLIVFLIGVAFLQFFSTVPLYYHEAYKLSEDHIGLLMMLNGGLIFLIEMPLIKGLEKPSISPYLIILVSILLMSLSFLVFNWFQGIWILVLSMAFLSIGEILNFPFLNSLSLKRAERGNMGDYMALFSIAFSLSHIVGHKLGMELVKAFGYTATWYVMGGITLLAFGLTLILNRIKL